LSFVFWFNFFLVVVVDPPFFLLLPADYAEASVMGVAGWLWRFLQVEKEKRCSFRLGSARSKGNSLF
jgi:hypothetical protein